MLIKEAGVGGAGKIAPSSLEASTVDLSAEFTGLIQTQKAYSASSKIITTADQMLEELINIKR
jgi:flagellar hook protein FlgE